MSQATVGHGYPHTRVLSDGPTATPPNIVTASVVAIYGVGIAGHGTQTPCRFHMTIRRGFCSLEPPMDGLVLRAWLQDSAHTTSQFTLALRVHLLQTILAWRAIEPQQPDRVRCDLVPKRQASRLLHSE